MTELSQSEQDQSEMAESGLAQQAENQQWKILCVDDEQSVLNALKRLLRNGPYTVTLANSPEEGLEVLKAEAFDIIISDMRMPGMSGAEFLAASLDIHPNCIRILLTGYSDMDSTISAVNEGRIHQYIQKPWNNQDLLLTLEQCVERLNLRRQNERLMAEVEQKNHQLAMINDQLEEKVQLRTKQIRQTLAKLERANSALSQSLRSTVKSFYNVISMTPHLGGKSALKTADLCKQMATALSCTPAEIRAVHLAGLLYQLGLIGIDEELLATPWKQLSAAQEKEYLSHPEKAVLALAPAQGLNSVTLLIKHQYERPDGNGLPDKLSAEAIPMGSKILAVARDFYLALSGDLTGTRLSTEGAIDYLNSLSGSEYDADVLAVLPALLAEEQEALSENEQLIPLTSVQPGMKLTRNLLNEKDILLLAEGHVFSEDSYRKLKVFNADPINPLMVYVVANKESGS